MYKAEAIVIEVKLCYCRKVVNLISLSRIFKGFYQAYIIIAPIVRASIKCVGVYPRLPAGRILGGSVKDERGRGGTREGSRAVGRNKPKH